MVFKNVDAELEVDQISFDDGWDMLQVEDPASDTFVNVWATADGSVEIHLVKDPMVGLDYLTLYGDDVADVQLDIEERSSFWSTGEALREIGRATDRDDRLRAVYTAALSATDAESDAVAEAFRTVSRDDDPGIRLSVVVATGYLQTPGLVEIVAGLAADDPHDTVRENARILLEGIERERGGGW
ncbi:hypothetical protein GCM10010112_24330 [Actinoplanes lobatus]|uniref:HEAT repeat domain-containing protein n=1 Tax=Actinoplanes lobatus TaxID=113568 RepID=A0A7W7HJ30_9ACTN|nr:HEAT repeat domain-containing protein [Actinoplanes lobatus]MBB4751475.1 hypothetical protein [Actinoplanes lobatus]GGN64281.1 hypothetical protein GCM10010112_24330 [Actinoplanes lobatus]GIE41084.1 hypothetical protein Alo02nite_39820 [Actinoplanes lobatus]